MIPVPNTRSEDLAWMADTGEHLTGAARRLGISRDALEKWARRHHPDLLARLLAREPIDPVQPVRRNQWTAA